MFIRFVVHEHDPRSPCPQGIFGVAYELRDSDCLQPYELQWLDQTLDWFSANLPVPNCFTRPEAEQAICWFRKEATAPVSRIWDLVALLEEHAAPIRLIRTANPGTIIYSDPLQVVAVPPIWRWGRRQRRRRRRPRWFAGLW